MKTVKIIYNVKGQTKTIKSAPVDESQVQATKSRLKAKATKLADELMPEVEMPSGFGDTQALADYKAYRESTDAFFASITFDVAEA